MIHTHDSKHISDVRHKEGQQQPHTQDGESCNDVDQPGEGPTSKQHQHHSLAGLHTQTKMNPTKRTQRRCTVLTSGPNVWQERVKALDLFVSIGSSKSANVQTPNKYEIQHYKYTTQFYKKYE